MGVEIFTCVARRKPKIEVIFFVTNAEEKVLAINFKKKTGWFD